jgi:hypothetical protein
MTRWNAAAAAVAISADAAVGLEWQQPRGHLREAAPRDARVPSEQREHRQAERDVHGDLQRDVPV